MAPYGLRTAVSAGSSEGWNLCLCVGSVSGLRSKAWIPAFAGILGNWGCGVCFGHTFVLLGRVSFPRIKPGVQGVLRLRGRLWDRYLSHRESLTAYSHP